MVYKLYKHLFINSNFKKIPDCLTNFFNRKLSTFKLYLLFRLKIPCFYEVFKILQICMTISPKISRSVILLEVYDDGVERQSIANQHGT